MNSAHIHEQGYSQYPPTYMSMNGVDVVDSNGYQEQHVYLHVWEILGIRVMVFMSGCSCPIHPIM